MKINLQLPFSCHYSSAYLVINKEPRRNVILYKSNSERTTISYARYVMSVNLGFIVPPEYVVDHIDGDKMNDDLLNYQLLSEHENFKKGLKQNNVKRSMVKFKCGVCSQIFIKRRKNTHFVIKTKSNDFCSRVCAGIASHRKLVSEVLEEYTENSI